MDFNRNKGAHLPLAEPSHEDAGSFQLIFNQYSNKVYRLALLYLKASDAAEEILQEVFLKLWSNREKIEGLNSPEAWLRTVTKHAILNHLKKRANETIAIKKFTKDLLRTANDTDYKIRGAQYLELVQQAIQELSVQQKTVYILAREHELSYEQIGALLSLSPLTVKTHMSRALSSIRQFFKHKDMAAQ